MVLAVDVGNSTTTIGLFDEDGRPVFFSDIATSCRKSTDECAIDLLGVFQLYAADIQKVDGSIISCVVPLWKPALPALWRGLPGAALW